MIKCRRRWALRRDKTGFRQRPPESATGSIRREPLAADLWQITIRAGKLQRSLILVLTLLAAYSSTQLSLPTWATVFVGFIVVVFGTRRALCIPTLRLTVEPSNQNSADLTSHDQSRSSALWRVVDTSSSNVISGQLIKAGYRSAVVVVLVIQASNGRWHYLPVWNDAVSDREFSYLHCQLAFNSKVPETRSPAQWLMSLVR